MKSAPFRPFTLAFLVIVISLLTCGVIAAQTNTGARAHLPIEFEPNHGQLTKSTLYLAHTQELLVSLEKAQVDVTLAKGGVHEVVSFKFEQSNPDTSLTVSEPTGGESNYLIGDPALWRTHIPHFDRVTYNQIYPGVDLAFYGSGPYLEHDFIVAPGMDPDCIRLQVVSNKSQIRITEQGDLKVAVGDGAIILRKPQVFQLEGSSKHVIEGRFRLYATNEVGFQIGEYDKSRALVIDPALSASTYLADLSLNVAAVATDGAGNTYITGLTFSASYPVTPSAFQPNCASCGSNLSDVFVTKLNPAGTAQLYSTYLGGSDYDQPFGLAVDANGNAIVAGRTQSTDFPTKNPIAHGFAGVGTSYGFISSLSADGSTLNYSSILGGSSQQFGSSTTIITAVTVDQLNNAYVAGQTDSAVYPVSGLNCCSAAYPNSIVFVTKFLPTGKLGYSALVGNPTPQNGGGGLIGATALQVDGLGSAYVSGQAGTLWPITTGAYQNQIGGPAPYAAPFITKLKPDGTAVVYSTYLGSGSVSGIALDALTNVWVTGTPGENFPTTKGAYQTVPPASNCCVPFLSKLDATGSKLLYSTFFYGDPNSFGYSTPSGIALDSVGGIWLAGSTSDAQWPLVKPIQALPSAGYLGSMGFVSRFTPAGTKLTFSTLFGSASAGTMIAGLALDGKGRVHISGFAHDDLYTTAGAFMGKVTPPPPFFDYTYGFAAVINTQVNSGTVCVLYPNNQGVYFGNVQVGTTAKQSLIINNCGSAPLTITGLGSSSSEFAVPNNLNGCQQTIAIGASCTLTIAFTPTQVTQYSANLTITSTASIHTTVFALSGNGAVPQIQTNTQSVGFDPQFLFQTSPPQFVFVNNAGFAPLLIDLAHTSISGDFAFTQSSCDQPLQAGSYCLFELTFKPNAAGQRNGQFSIASNDPSNPVLRIDLAGTGYSKYPFPSITQLSSSTVAISSAAVTLTVFGNNFFPASVAKVNGVPQTTVYSNSSALQVTIDPSFLTSMVSLNLTVANPTPGGGHSAISVLTVYRSVPIEASALVYDSSRNLLYAAIPATASLNPNSVVFINPSTGVLGRSIPVGNDPQRLAISDDDQFLYVGLNGDNTIQRINLKTRLVEKTFAVPVDPYFGQTRAQYMKVVPGSPDQLVVSLFRTASPAEDGVALYNDTGLVNWIPNDFQHGYATVDSFAFAGSPALLYAVPFLLNPSFFQSYSISNSGIKAVSNTNSFGQYEGAVIASDGKLLYVADGTVWDPVIQKQVGAINPPLFFAVGIVPDTTLGRTFYLDPYSSNGVAVESYSQGTLVLRGSVAFSNLYAPNVFALNRWGTTGFAFLVGNFVPTQDSNQLMLFKSPI